MMLLLRLAEIIAAEEFRRQHDIGALPGRLTDETCHAIDVVLHVVTRA
jgi:hypothetical protein